MLFSETFFWSALNSQILSPIATSYDSITATTFWLEPLVRAIHAILIVAAVRFELTTKGL